MRSMRSCVTTSHFQQRTLNKSQLVTYKRAIKDEAAKCAYTRSSRTSQWIPQLLQDQGMDCGVNVTFVVAPMNNTRDTRGAVQWKVQHMRLADMMNQLQYKGSKQKKRQFGFMTMQTTKVYRFKSTSKWETVSRTQSPVLRHLHHPWMQHSSR